MNTIELEYAKQKGAKLSSFLDGLHHFPSATSGLAAYHAAQAVKAANQRVALESRVAACKRALKAFNVTVSIGENGRGIRTVRLHSAIKQTEVLL